MTLHSIKIPISRGAESCHTHYCACGQEVWHNGASAECQDSFMPEFQCASCQPYVYEDLLLAGEIRPISMQLQDWASTGLSIFILGLITGWLICR